MINLNISDAVRYANDNCLIYCHDGRMLWWDAVTSLVTVVEPKPYERSDPRPPGSMRP